MLILSALSLLTWHLIFKYTGERILNKAQSYSPQSAIKSSGVFVRSTLQTDVSAVQDTQRLVSAALSLDRTFETRYSKLIEKLKLSPVEYEREKTLLISRQLRIEAVFLDIRDKRIILQLPGSNVRESFTPPFALPSDWKDRLANAKSEPDIEMKNMLGEERYAEYIFYMETRALRGAVLDPLQKNLVSKSLDALDEPQQHYLLTDLAAANADNMDLWHDYFNDAVMRHASQYLNSAQMAELSNFATAHAEHAKAVQLILDRYMATHAH